MNDQLFFEFDVLGSVPVEMSEVTPGMNLEEGWQTGDMKDPGLAIRTVWYSDCDRRVGGCIDRSKVKELRDFLNTVIEKWELQESKKEKINE